jgi:Flp pilus assembly protein TadD
MGDFRGSSNYYRPMMMLGYLICSRLFGFGPPGFHLANLLANVGVVLLVFLVVRQMFRSQAVAVVAASLFALHPIHSEAVNWIAAVTELELALFYLLTFGLFLASARAAGRVSVPVQVAMAGSFVLALLSKEQALTLPLLATLYEHWFREDRVETKWEQKASRYAALWLLSAAYLVVRLRYLGGLAPPISKPGLEPGTPIIAVPALIGEYGWRLVWPVRLCAYYELPSGVATLLAWALAGILTLALCGWAGAVLWRVNRQAAFGIIWILATLAPVLNIRWMVNNAFAERYLYLPSVGFCWILGWAAMRCWDWLSARGSRWRAALPAAACLLGVLCMVRIALRNRDWRDDVTFYTSTLVISPDSYYMHSNLGGAYFARGNRAAAEKEWREALRLAPENEFVLHNLGLLAYADKHYEEAEGFLVLTILIRPNYSTAHLDLGKTYAAMGRWEEAETQLRAAVALSPLSVQAHNALGELYLDKRRPREAQAEARRSLEIEPTVRGYWDLGLADWMSGDRAGAEAAFLGAEALGPSIGRAHFMLGLFYMDSGRSADAVREYRKGLEFDPTNADALANLKKLQSPGNRAQR